MRLFFPFQLLVLFLCCSLLSARQTRPNILIISIDDLNDWVGCLGGHPQAKTPNIDRLAKRGTLFSNAVCQAPICTPSRASLVTGLLPSTTGLYFLQPGLSHSKVAAEQPTLMATLKSAGYKTMSAGKFVHGRKEGKYFDEYGGDFGGFGPNPEEKIHCPHGGINWDWGFYPEKDEDLPDDGVTNWVIDRLKEQQEQPFFLVAGLWRPHVPLYVPQKWFDLFPLVQIQLPKTLPNDREDLPPYAVDLTNGEPAPRHEWFVSEKKWKSAIQAYLASVAFADHCVGRILDALDKSPYANNTNVVLFSDHGWHLGEKERWAKRSLWTDGIRVPLIISAPGFPKGQITDRPAGLVDLYPTLMELSGVAKPPQLDGHSLVPFLKDPNAISYHPAVCTFGPNNHSLHFINYHYIRYADGSEELYHLKKDHHEWHNLAGQQIHAKRIAIYRQKLPEVNVAPVRTKWWNRWEIADWENAERNVEKRKPSKADK